VDNAAVPAWCAGLPKKATPFGFRASGAGLRQGAGIPRHPPGELSAGGYPCRLLLLEVIGVYCPQCTGRRLCFNTLFNRIEKAS